MIVVYGGDNHKEIAKEISSKFDEVYDFEPRIHSNSKYAHEIAHNVFISRKTEHNILAHGVHLKHVDVRIRRVSDMFVYSKTEFNSSVIVVTQAEKLKLAPCYYFDNSNLDKILWMDLRKTPAGVLVAWDNL